MILAVLAGALLFSDDFARRDDGLITNEYAYRRQQAPDAVRSRDWEVLSGSLLVRGGVGTTGVPDDTPANARSTNGTNSATFRLQTTRGDFGDVELSFDLMNEALTEANTTPAKPWDGAHAVLRYQGEKSFYYASVNRRDETAVLKKKAGDHFYDLAPAVQAAVPYGQWQKVRFSAEDNTDGSVRLKLWRDNRLLVEALDRGVAGPAIRGGGKAGLRGDNARLKFGHFKVESLGAGPAAAPAPASALADVAAKDVLDSSAQITWTTREKLYGRVEYGPSQALGLQTPWSAEATNLHRHSLGGLMQAKDYYYRAAARTDTGSPAYSPILRFTTQGKADTRAPDVSVVSPSNGQTVSGIVGLAAFASDDIGVAGVAWTVDGRQVSIELPNPPFSFQWDSNQVPPGQHVVRAVARDAANNRTFSNPVTVTTSGGR